jgi:hypothetical protein
MKTRKHKIVSLNSFIGIVNFALVFIIIVIFFTELNFRTKIGIGLTDEAFGILFGMDRAQNGQTANTYLFADITSPVLNILDYNIVNFRRIGIFILVILSLFMFSRFMKSVRNISFLEKLSYFSIFFISLLFLTSSFRFLLITPGYQWIILVSSILLAVLLIRSEKLISQKGNSIHNLVIALLILFVEFSRLTSGFAAWILIMIYLVRNSQIKKLVHVNALLLFFHLVYIIVFGDTFYRAIVRYYNLSKLDPYGSSFLLEVYDVGKALAMFVLLLLFGVKVGSIRFNDFLSKVKTNWQINILIILLLILVFFLQYRDIAHLLVYLFVFIFGVKIGIYKLSPSFDGLLLASLPIVTQFGSNINASFLLAPSLAAASLIFVVTFIFAKEINLECLSKGFRAANSLAMLVLTLILLGLLVLVSASGYENGYGSKNFKTDRATGLLYTPEKLQNIQAFRTQVAKLSQDKPVRVLDLSFWHPGVLYYIDQFQFPISTLDRYFSSTLSEQVELTLSQLEVSKVTRLTPILLLTNSQFPSFACKPLENWSGDERMISTLKEYRFNPKVKEIAIYKSSVEDLTLYPFNISYMIPCN